MRDGKTHNAEVDFVISQGTEILPVEVKAGKSGTLKSLHQFAFENNNQRGVRFDLNVPSKQTIQHQIQSTNDKHPVTYELISMPLYLVEQLFNWI